MATGVPIRKYKDQARGNWSDDNLEGDEDEDEDDKYSDIDSTMSNDSIDMDNWDGSNRIIE